AAVAGPRVDVDHNGRRHVAAGEHGVSGLGERLPEGGPVPPHGHVPGVALDDVYDRVPAVRLVVVPWRQVHEHRPFVRVAERVAAQQLAADDALVDAAGEIRGPGQHGSSFKVGALAYDAARWARMAAVTEPGV